jgi:HAD superfamily phosphatase (TIGR01668 family)
MEIMLGLHTMEVRRQINMVIVMFETFRPQKIHKTIFDVKLPALKTLGIKGLIIDLKNTLTREYALPEQVLKWLDQVQNDHGIHVVILSNSIAPEGETYKLLHGVSTIFAAGKPRKNAFLKALGLLGTKASETAIIGNGMFTDIFGGNRLGIYTIFVSPPNTRPRILRFAQRLLLKVFEL